MINIILKLRKLKDLVNNLANLNHYKGHEAILTNLIVIKFLVEEIIEDLRGIRND